MSQRHQRRPPRHRLPRAILGTHTVLAALIPAARHRDSDLTYAVRARFTHHVRLARWTFPTWLYVSVTGVVIYVMLYCL